MDHYAGIDLHSNNSYVAIIDNDNRRVFKRVRQIIRTFQMDAYAPSDSSGKAKEGHVANKRLEYLGCLIDEYFVHPSKKSTNAIKKKIRELLDQNSKQFMNVNSSVWNNDYSLIKTLQQVSNILMGWGNQYSFCNAKAFMRDIDREIDGYIRDYLKRYSIARNKLSSKNDLNILRNILGIYLLSESKPDPILPLKN